MGNGWSSDKDVSVCRGVGSYHRELFYISFRNYPLKTGNNLP